jgi:hypothetical protein
MEHNYLPLGSIVRLKDGTKKLMIFGRCMKRESEGDQFDYIGVPYPEGFINPELTFVFDHWAIEEVLFTGYKDQEEEVAQNLLQAHKSLAATAAVAE